LKEKKEVKLKLKGKRNQKTPMRRVFLKKEKKRKRSYKR